MITLINIGVNGILMGLIYGLMALGLSVVFGVIRVVNFAHGEMMLLGVYGAIILHHLTGIDPIFLSPVLAVVLFGLGYGLQRGLINRLLDKPEHVQFIVLAAVALILMNLQLMIFGPDAKAISVPYSLETFQIGAILVDKTRVYTSVVALLVALGLFAFFKYSLTGKKIRACADNHLGAKVIGLNHKHLYAVSFGIGAGCVAIAGSLVSILFNVTPHLAPELTLLGFVIVIIGGLGSMGGALFGGVLIGVVQAYAGYFTEPSLKALFSFGLLIIVLMFRPEGLLKQS
ncbi:MAG: branched-chain amino acid ABC transporter permease [Alphaproteobacteria bacterium]|nr:branched-chain amino acid ABC transporter permease [Alphaproteobacteria bacterium]